MSGAEIVLAITGIEAERREGEMSGYMSSAELMASSREMAGVTSEFIEMAELTIAELMWVTTG